MIHRSRQLWFLARVLIAMFLITSYGMQFADLVGLDAHASRPISLVVLGRPLVSEVAPVTQAGRLLVPFRAIGEALGATVEWQDRTSSVVLELGGTRVILRIGESRATVNERVVQLDVASSVRQGRTMVPLRFVSEALGFRVAWDEANATVTVGSALPQIASLTVAPAAVYRGQQVNIVTVANDPDGDSLTYVYEVSGGHISGSGPSVVWHAPAKAGAYYVGVRVSDGTGGSANHRLSVLVANRAPVVANITTNPASVLRAQQVNIMALASDPDGDPLTFSYRVSGGTIHGSGANVTWVAPSAVGTYSITVTVDDGQGGVAEHTVEVPVINSAPSVSAVAVSPASVSRGQSTAVAVTASDPDGDPLTFSYSVSGGTIQGSGANVTWVAPNAVGTYSITVTVADGQGGTAERIAEASVIATIGDTVSFADWDYKVLRVEQHNTLGTMFTQNIAKGRYLVAIVEFRNRALFARQVGTNWVVVDSLGRRFDMDSSASLGHHHAFRTETWHLEDIGPSFSGVVAIAFDIPIDASNVILFPGSANRVGPADNARGVLLIPPRPQPIGVQPQPTPPPVPPLTAVGNIGDTVSFADWDYKVLRVEQHNTLGTMFTQNIAKGRYLVAIVEFRNRALFARQVGTNWVVVDSLGRRFDMDSSASLGHHHAFRTETWHLEDIGPSFSGVVAIAFDIPIDASNVILFPGSANRVGPADNARGVLLIPPRPQPIGVQPQPTPPPVPPLTDIGSIGYTISLDLQGERQWELVSAFRFLADGQENRSQG